MCCQDNLGPVQISSRQRGLGNEGLAALPLLACSVDYCQLHNTRQTLNAALFLMGSYVRGMLFLLTVLFPSFMSKGCRNLHRFGLVTKNKILQIQNPGSSTTL